MCIRDRAYAQGYDRRYGKDGFMLLVPAPQDLRTGAPGQSGIATVHICLLYTSTYEMLL